jgi:hypothetical protein
MVVHDRESGLRGMALGWPLRWAQTDEYRRDGNRHSQRRGGREQITSGAPQRDRRCARQGARRRLHQLLLESIVVVAHDRSSSA